ncbi:hypothetical protein [Clostridium sp. E02]|uniref:hypothetical protein n=1 Tax=Clostridium sp. E02 TaxID=2487134 RepID=UPI000F54524B|nr:hypothetical protein [Clostridium sp. E02]
MKIKKFECIIDDGEHVWKEYIPATSKKKLMNTWRGNGDFIKIEEIPEYLPSALSVRETLEKSGYGKAECDLVYRILYQYVEGTEN